jgi:hypothetical protein
MEKSKKEIMNKTNNGRKRKQYTKDERKKHHGPKKDLVFFPAVAPSLRSTELKQVLPK